MPAPARPASRPVGRRRAPTREERWSVLLVAVAVVWALGSVVNVAFQVGVQGRSPVWLLEVPLSLAVSYLVGIGAWRRLRARR